MDSFSSTTINGTLLFQYTPWKKRGIRHGFLGKPLSFSDSVIAESATRFCEKFSFDSLCSAKQLHGKRILEIGADPSFLPHEHHARIGEGDALLAQNIERNLRLALGVRTADCLPVFFLTPNKRAVVHAGWRGLAANILGKITTELSLDSDSKNQLEVLIGPAAGVQHYEVGEEVIEAIGRFAVNEKREGKLFLNLQQTAQEQILNSNSRTQLERLDICTISDPRFFSYRREGAGVGHNLSFLSAA